MFAVKVKDWRILGISKNEASKITKAEPPPMSVAMKTNVASDAIEVVDDLDQERKTEIKETTKKKLKFRTSLEHS